MAKTPSVYERMAPFLMVVVIGMAFVVGVLWQKVNSLQGGTGNNTNPTAALPAQPQAPQTGLLPEDQAALLDGVTEQDHVLGSRDAEVFLIEYSDFSCGYCARFHDTAKQAVEDYDGRVAWVFRHFPFLSPASTEAALASECVAELGGDTAFWSFANSVFGDNHPEGLSDISGLALATGVNRAQYETCVTEQRHQAKVDEQYQSGSTAGVSGTPGNFVMNSKGQVWMLPGAVPYESLVETIEEALAS